MKKIYTRCRVPLLVWLFSFHTLSSCVNTGRALGMARESNKISRKKGPKFYHELGVCMESCPYCENPCLKYKELFCAPKFKKVLAGSLVLSGLGAGLYYYIYMLPVSNPMDGTMPNTTMSSIANTTTALVAPITPGLVNMVNTTLSSIGTVVTTVATLLPTAGLIAALQPNGLNGNNSIEGESSDRVKDPIVDEGLIERLKLNGFLDSNYSSPNSNNSSPTTLTPFTPSDSDTNTIPREHKLSNIKPIALIKEVADDINQHGFAPSQIEYWMKKLGPNIVNAEAAEKRTLLMEAANLNILPAVEFLVSNGANVNAQDDIGNTPLMYALDRLPQTKLIVDYLLKNGANPCIKNIDGRPSDADVKKFNDQTLEELNQCNTLNTKP